MFFIFFVPILWALIPILTWIDKKKYYNKAVHLEGKELDRSLLTTNILEVALFTLGYVLCYIDLIILH